MGIGQVARLLEHGHEMHAFDPDEVTRAEVEKLGASSFVSVSSLISSLQAPHNLGNGSMEGCRFCRK